MPSRSRKRKTVSEPNPAVQAQPARREKVSLSLITLIIAAAVLMVYAVPLFDSATSIQWDAVDVHYSSYKYFAGAVRAGHLLLWTPCLFSGMPFLADPQVGAWYPMNWPFFLIGISPRVIQWNIALHVFVAAFGAFLLARDLLKSYWSAAFAAALYALSGFFAGHGSHVGMVQAASLFPWLLWAGLRAARLPQWLPVAAIFSGALVLTGHFQTALYAFCALALVITAAVFSRRCPVRNALFVLLAASVGAATVPAVMTMPALELTAQSERAASNYVHDANAVLVPEALLTLLSPDHYHAPEVRTYTGPSDVTQFYLYQGVLLLPLAIVGLIQARKRWLELMLIVPALWYAFGPAGKFYLLAAWLPGLRSVRSPINDWFIVALGLALLAASGVSAIRTRYSSRWLAPVLLVLTLGDLWYWNMDRNQMAYARQSFEELYGNNEDRFRNAVNALGAAAPLTRVWAPAASPAFGPLNGSLDSQTAVTFGYNPLALRRYARYMAAAAIHPRLLDELGATIKFDVAQSRFVPNPAAMPRMSAPLSVVAVSQDEAARRLGALDPGHTALAETSAPLPQSGAATLQLTNYEDGFYRARVDASQRALIRLAEPYFPGWRAEIDGHAQPVFPVDLALMGTMVPAGRHDLVFRFRSTWLGTGAAISLLSIAALAFWMWRAFAAARFAQRAL